MLSINVLIINDFIKELAAIKQKDEKNGNNNSDHNQRLHAL